MQVTLIDHMGSDLSVVNAARVSFSKKSEWEEHGALNPEAEALLVLSRHDQKLIQFLARENHWTPFGHTAVTLHIEAPLFVARQLGKHQVGLVWNEVSRRYVDDEPEFYRPEVWRKRAENVKQGSSDETIKDGGWYPDEFESHYGDHFMVDNDWTGEWFAWDDPAMALGVYNQMLECGVCPEQARMVLPQSMMTEWYWTGNIAAFARVCNLRLDSHTQKETQEVAQKIAAILMEHFPVSMKALLK